MSLAYKKEKPATAKDIKKYEKLKAEIESSNENEDVKRFQINLMDSVGWAAYTSWFKGRAVFLRSGWFVIYIPNQWTKVAMNKSYAKILTKLNVILHVEG